MSNPVVMLSQHIGTQTATLYLEEHGSPMVLFVKSTMVVLGHRWFLNQSRSYLAGLEFKPEYASHLCTPNTFGANTEHYDGSS